MLIYDFFSICWSITMETSINFFARKSAKINYFFFLSLMYPGSNYL